MRFTRRISCPVELNKIFIETPQFSRDEKILTANKKLIAQFVDELKKFPSPEKNFWRGVPKKSVADLILNFQTGKWQHNFQSQPISEYISAKMDAELWDVCIPEGNGELYGALTIGGENFPVKPLARKISIIGERILISGTKLRVGSQGVTRRGLDDKQIAAVEKFFHERRGKKISVPDNFYMIHGRNPLLVLYVVHTDKPALKILFALGND